MSTRTLLPALALIALVVVGVSAAARSATPTPIAIDVNDRAYVMPDVIKGSVVAMRFRNLGTELHGFDMVRIDKGHTYQEALSAFKQNKEVSWAHDAAGPGLLTSGAQITITRKLPPGTYYFFDSVPNTNGVPHWKLGIRRAFTVTSGSNTQLPTADTVVTANAKRFVVPQLHAGRQVIELRNRAGSGREFLLATINPGKTEADVERWSKSVETTGKLPAGPVPMTLLGAIQTIPSNTSVYLTVKLEAGRRYHLSDGDAGLNADFTPR